MEEKITVNKAELKKTLELSERRRIALAKAYNVISVVIGPDGIPERKYKLISKVTKIIQNPEKYESVLNTIDDDFLTEVQELIKEG